MSVCLRNIYFFYVPFVLLHGIELYANTYASPFDKLFKLNNTLLRILLFKQLDFPVVKLYYNCNTFPLLYCTNSKFLLLFTNFNLNFRHHRDKLLLDTMMCIFEDVNEIQVKKIEAERLEKEITRNPRKFASDELYSLLHIEETTLKREPLNHTNVVCESGRCAAVEAGYIVYPQVCCRDCIAPLMYFCSRMNWLADCKKCGCCKSQHRRRTTITKVVKELVYRPNDRVVGKIVDSNDALRQINKGISQFENRIKECSEETHQMIEICAKLNAFAQQNVSVQTPSTDDELLRCLENQRQTYARSPNTGRQAEDLEEIKSQYERQLTEAKGHSYRVEDVPRLIDQLCQLPMKGGEIKQAVDAYERSRRRAVEQSKKSKKNYTVKRLSDKFSFSW